MCIALCTSAVTAVPVKHWVSLAQLWLGDVRLSVYDARSVRGHGYVPLSRAGERYSQVITRG